MYPICVCGQLSLRCNTHQPFKALRGVKKASCSHLTTDSAQQRLAQSSCVCVCVSACWFHYTWTMQTPAMLMHNVSAHWSSMCVICVSVCMRVCVYLFLYPCLYLQDMPVPGDTAIMFTPACITACLFAGVHAHKYTQSYIDCVYVKSFWVQDLTIDILSQTWLLCSSSRLMFCSYLTPTLALVSLFYSSL